METQLLLVILIGTLVAATVSKRIRETIISLPMVYTLFGLLVAVIFPNLSSLSYESPVVEAIAQLTLILILASDSSRIQIADLTRYHNLPLRMLVFALPLTIIIGTLIGAIIFPGSSIWTLAILAVTLAPIDSSLAVSSVENPKVPMRIRQTLNVEGGMDDGITLPFLFLFISLAISSETGLQIDSFISFTAQHIAFGILVGLIMGFLGARYISWGNSSGWMSSQFQKISWLALVLLTFGVAEVVEGNGFIAAFFFGIVSGNLVDKGDSDRLHRFATVENTILEMLTFMFFGSVILYPVLQVTDFSIIIYAILSLTLVRMLPVAISLIGTKLRLESMLYLSWFGPRGIASILYFYTILRVEDIPDQTFVLRIVVITVFLSVLTHGMSSVPLTNWYAQRITKLETEGHAQAETKSVPGMPTRSATLNGGAATPKSTGVPNTGK